MGKDSRLSFRISTLLDDRIERAIDKSEGQIRDRSEFGTKAIKFYLDYIENTKSEEEIVMDAILALAEFVGENGSEVKHIKAISEDRNIIPSVLASKKRPQDHPDFDKLIGILERSKDTDFYKELNTKLRDAAYEDVEDLYEEYSEKFFLRAEA